MRTHRSGFTLIELLVVIAIIAVLIALLLTSRVRSVVRLGTSRNHFDESLLVSIVTPCFRMEPTMILAGPQTVIFDPTPLIFIGMFILIWPIVLYFGVRLVRNSPFLAGIAVRLGVFVLFSSITLLFIQFYVIEFEPERRAVLFKQGLFWALLLPSPIYVPLLLAPLAVRRKDPNTPSE